MKVVCSLLLRLQTRVVLYTQLSVIYSMEDYSRNSQSAESRHTKDSGHQTTECGKSALKLPSSNAGCLKVKRRVSSPVPLDGVKPNPVVARSNTFGRGQQPLGPGQHIVSQAVLRESADTACVPEWPQLTTVIINSKNGQYVY
jgi:hypothetical protein